MSTVTVVLVLVLVLALVLLLGDRGGDGGGGGAHFVLSPPTSEAQTDGSTLASPEGHWPCV